MARRSILSEEDPTQIDLSPMIDCIFILLIFFIVTTVFVEEKGMPGEQARRGGLRLAEEQENVVIEITAENEIRFQNSPIPLADVAGRVKGSVTGADTPVVIRVNEKSKYGTFVAVWDAAKRGGAATLSFSTVN